MSLINDALRRAKEAQEDAPPPPHPGPPLRPVEPENYVRHGVGLVLPVALALVALLVLFFVWRYAPRGHAAKQDLAAAASPEVRARDLRSPDSPPATPVPRPENDATPTPAPEVQGATAVSAAASTPPVKSPAVAANAEAVAPAQPTNSVAAPPPEPPKPAVPKLQGIVFNPRRPSAVINGKTLFMGDRVAGFRLVAIGPDSATLVSGSQTNVLTLEE